MLYWEDSDSLRDHVIEAGEMDLVFRSLNFETEIHPIPNTDSHYNVEEFLIRQQLSLSLDKRYFDLPRLLIIHYSGHGDRGDDKYIIDDSQNERVVWRP